MIGKEIRLKRLIPGTDGKYFGLTVDHAIARGVMPGLDTIDDTLSKMVAGGLCGQGRPRAEAHHLRRVSL